MTRSIEFFYDIVCPYAYLAAMQIEDIANQCSLTIKWKPVLLGGIYKSISSPQQPSQQWPEEKIQWNALDLRRQVKKAGVEFTFNPKHPQRTVEVMRLLSVCPVSKRAQMTKHLYKAYWVDNINFPNDKYLNQIAISFGLEKDCFKSKDAKDLLFKNTEEALKRGLFGVPSICFDDQIIWGQDRLFFLTEYYGKNTHQWPTSINKDKTLYFFHDFASPFSFLAAMVIEELSQNCGIEINYKPILVGGLFQKIGTPIVPLFTMSKSKQHYLTSDIKRWANWWKTEFNWPTQFPMRTLLPLRVAIILPQLTKEIYQAYWIEGQDISTPEVLAPLIKKAGFNPKEIFNQTKLHTTKEILKENTKEAQQNGACGVPYFQIGDEYWWGQDRLIDIANYLK
jgi:2-hydroxychromene-2-carboxylate isomerase